MRRVSQIDHHRRNRIHQIRNRGPVSAVPKGTHNRRPFHRRSWILEVVPIQKAEGLPRLQLGFALFSTWCYTCRSEGLVMRIRALVLTLVSSATLLGQSWRPERARLCFDRPENNGRMNIYESWVRLSGHYRVPLIGDQTACVYVDAGRTDLIVTSGVPYDEKPEHQEVCKSKVMKLDLARGENRLFTIWPATGGPSYACGWVIVPAPSARSKRKTVSPRQ